MVISEDKMLPASKSSDPKSSHLAERKITESGARQSHMLRVAGLVSNFIGYTASELAEHTLLTEIQVRRRLSDARAFGLIKKGDIRDSRITGLKELTWYPDHDQKYCEAQDVIRKKSSHNKTVLALSAEIVNALGEKFEVPEQKQKEMHDYLTKYVGRRLSMISCNERCKKGGQK